MCSLTYMQITFCFHFFNNYFVLASFFCNFFAVFCFFFAFVKYVSFFVFSFLTSVENICYICSICPLYHLFFEFNRNYLLYLYHLFLYLICICFGPLDFNPRVRKSSCFIDPKQPDLIWLHFWSFWCCTTGC